MLNRPQDLFYLLEDTSVSKSSLNSLIQNSKIENSSFWGGSDFIINNTPQQGINWIGDFRNGDYNQLKGIIVKAINQDEYPYDGWVDSDKKIYRYSYRKDRNMVDYQKVPNMVLIQQKRFKYKVLLFTSIENDNHSLRFHGFFNVQNSITESAYPHVILEKDEQTINNI